MGAKQTTLPTADLIRKYFDEVVTSSGIDPQKRPDVVLQWAQEKELWAQETDAKMQQQLLQVLKINQKVQAQQLHRQQELILRDLQQSRLVELKKREEYLATLAKPVKLPKINKKILNSEIEAKDSLPKSFFAKDNKMTPSYEEDNYGTILMREIGQALANEYEIYHPVQIEKPIKQGVVPKITKWQRLIYKKGLK
ncbi:hypothetical protein S100390_v1c05940 [Spiroplasma sp. NBRC 100390]|uniref:hypothetical protein n=1 Tax=unclassified Spiroplasma TaxID=2637901 RepID=UPI0008929C1C|nr:MULTISPECIES: hypothetical protein [unclassified Spiroplasma]AOX43931.1 hypothetical protein STU14_v1c05940 [Spiroplasma sp. TU-14]APE13401.1 hypothetical protein S100390_v1c05940 [Spiroplasma sp. NBRC 100390]